MKKTFALLAMTSLVAGCVLVPVDHGPPHCPPGQAKKGNCSPHSDRGFIPPGHSR